MLRVYIDASTKGNPGPSGGGIVILGENRYEQLAVPLSDGSNHEAEFEVFLKTLEILKEKELNTETIFCYSDSKTLVSTIDKNFTTNELFQPYLSAIQSLLPTFSLFLLQWIPESKNKGADNLARQALKKQLQQTKK
ncbi:ribonuclease HI family protein [Enterococcus thailandicus]|uniref:Ribonuclease HI n=1 Tax=Enterococcus thailandicus TaxID=417368 RepID=A0A179ETI8_ENTTH|nr:ribonuclease HI family protein [Enterococcus thailandicus]ASZ07684.1 ribonuclease HI [Enterococcus thailandicus]MDA3965673.1 ribonuclease HI family protein [Enterococcus thailandicus]MDT2793677.1 ribonuclease HI family protein [Enterococcus thailandicus]OAQ56524.1 ribonuclease HI [Enterococcus thailandicus]GMC04379.1 ribonuclease HI [Enterococcus thailandicus]